MFEGQRVVNGQVLVDQAMARTRSDEDELELAVREHARLVYRIAYSVLRNHHDAEDATQEGLSGWCAIAESWRGYATRGPSWRALHGGSQSSGGEGLLKSRSMTRTRWFDRFVPWPPGQRRSCWERK